MSKKPTVLMILDGYGLNKRKDGNAVALADTPVMDKLMAEYPFVEGQASGLAVGLPEGQMGNSEVGHLNMGAGRIVYQELTRITKEIEDGDFFKNEALLAACKNAKENNSALHLYGLVSDGGVHSHITHIYGLLELAKREGVEKVYVHCFLDGRDTPPASGKGYVEQLEAKMKEIGVGEVVSVMGRYYASHVLLRHRQRRLLRALLQFYSLREGDTPTLLRQQRLDLAVRQQNGHGGRGSVARVPAEEVAYLPMSVATEHDQVLATTVIHELRSDENRGNFGELVQHAVSRLQQREPAIVVHHRDLAHAAEQREPLGAQRNAQVLQQEKEEILRHGRLRLRRESGRYGEIDEEVLNIGIHKTAGVSVVLEGGGDVVEVLLSEPAARHTTHAHALHKQVVVVDALHADTLFLRLLHLIALDVADRVQDLRVVVLLRALLRHRNAVSVQ